MKKKIEYKEKIKFSKMEKIYCSYGNFKFKTI